MISPSSQRWLKPVSPGLTSSGVTATEELLTWWQEPALRALLMVTLPSPPPSAVRVLCQVLRERGCRASWGMLTQLTVFCKRDVITCADRQAGFCLRADAPLASPIQQLLCRARQLCQLGYTLARGISSEFCSSFLAVSTDNSFTTFFPLKFSHFLAEMARAVTQVNVSGAGLHMGCPSGGKGTWLLLSKA